MFPLLFTLLFSPLLLNAQHPSGDPFAGQPKDYVDPRIGSEGLGRVFIGPCMPFGMVKPGPDCGVSNNAGWAPMPAAVSGFTQTHVSGTGGGPKYGNILIRPFSGADQHRASEKIELGRYTCTFQESGIKAEVTASRRASLYRFTYPERMKPHLEIDLSHFLGRNPVPKAREAQQFEEAHLDSTLREDGLYDYYGHQTISGGWNNGKPYTVYFYTTSTLLHQDETANNPLEHHANELHEHRSNGLHEHLANELHQHRSNGLHEHHANELLVKVGISFVSVEQARLNMLSDLPDWDFDATHRRCLEEWNTLLSRLPIQDEASEQVKRMYYTALYHMCLMPTEREDGTYDDYYAIWDTYRTSTPLLTLLAPERATAIANSLLTIYQKDGFLPDARSGNSNGRTQGGSNAEIVLCDAIANGLDINADLALEAMLKDATVAPEDDEAEGRGGLAEYNRLGYIPYINTQSRSTQPAKLGDNNYENEPRLRIPRAGNRTIEYAFCDWAIAETARLMKERHLSKLHSDTDLESIYHQYMEQSTRWKNLWRTDYQHDGARGFIMPRDEKGNWLDNLPFGHSKALPLTFRYTPDVSYEGPWYCKWWDCFMYEASSWEYSFAIPHDIPELIEKCGGKDAFEARLDTFFAHGYYNVANEPSFLTPLLYHWIGKPDKSTALIRSIIEKHFNDQPDGLPGNDDGGAMSSWLACHLLGMYPLAGTTEWIKYAPIDSLSVPPVVKKANELTKETTPSAETDKLQAVETPEGFEVKYSLHGQTRRYYITPELTAEGVRMHYKILRNLRWWHGSFFISDKALRKAARHTYEQPVDGLQMTLPDDQTFLYLPQEAWHDIQKNGRCTFDNQTWTLVDRQALILRSSEGAEMQLSDSVLHDDLHIANRRLRIMQPMIVKMKNNPTEINWEITRYHNQK